MNSGIRAVYVVTQFKAQSLIEHLDQCWRVSSFLKDRFLTPVPAQMQTGEEWYSGTANALYQNLALIRRAKPELVAVFAGDHICRMDVWQMVEEHQAKGADVTVAALPVAIEEASRFGVIEVDEEWWVLGFQEKPRQPRPLPGDRQHVLASMGNYLFNADVLIQALVTDAYNRVSSHDFGRDILPAFFRERKVYAYDFRKNRILLPLKGEEHSYCFIEDSILMDWVEVGHGCRIRRAIIDKNVTIAPETEIGYDLERDWERFFVSETGIVIIPRAEPKHGGVAFQRHIAQQCPQSGSGASMKAAETPVMKRAMLSLVFTASRTVRVIPNKFPALRIEGDLERVGVGIYDKMSAVFSVT